MSTVYEVVKDQETWDWLFKNLSKWEKQNFPKGSWYQTKETVSGFIDMQKLGNYHAVVAWTFVNGKREFSGLTTWWFERRGKVDTAWVNEVFVVKKFHRRGIAQGMLEIALNLISFRDKRIARILVIEDNFPMLTLQQKLMEKGYYQLEKLSNLGCEYWGDGRKLHYMEYRGKMGRTKPVTLS